jgi:NAD(P)-dependent dehydrogenase (short-subunit alcohol dehydrogenase family)
MRDLQDKAVIVTGGTKGIGLATALNFGRRGGTCILTYHWGSASEDEVIGEFEKVGAPRPVLFNADVSRQEDTERLMEALVGQVDYIDTFVSNAAVSATVRNLDELSIRDMRRTFDYSVAPTIGYLQAIQKSFGRPPKYMVALSSAGIDHFFPNYALVAAAKAALEALCRYVTVFLKDEDFRFNIVRTLAVRTDSFKQVFGPDFEDAILRLISSDRLVDETEVADVILALCSGLFDGLKGQTITVDKGALFGDNIMRLYDERHKLESQP